LFFVVQSPYAEDADSMPIADLEVLCDGVWLYPVTQPTSESEKNLFYLMLAVADLCDVVFQHPVPTAHTIGWYSRGSWLKNGAYADAQRIQLLEQIFYENTDIRFSDVEHIAIFFYDDALRLVSRKIVATGNHRSVGIALDVVMREAQRLGATRIVFSHNHPYAACLPSEADLSAVDVAEQYFSPLGMVVHDFVVVTQDCLYSLEAHKGHQTVAWARQQLGYHSGE